MMSSTPYVPGIQASTQLRYRFKNSILIKSNDIDLVNGSLKWCFTSHRIKLVFELVSFWLGMIYNWVENRFWVDTLFRPRAVNYEQFASLLLQ